MIWGPLDNWIVLIGALAAMACALLGNFLVLKRQSMMGDAISHAVLPGIALAYLIFHTRAPLEMFAASVATGILTAMLIQLLHRYGNIEEGAAMGVVFTTLFAIGLILIRRGADHVHLDPDCVLFGAIELAPLHLITIAGITAPIAAFSTGFMLLVNLVFVLVFYKELKISSFDPALAHTLGMHPTLLHYALMALVATTMVAAFESVGSILVIAMLIVPPVCAYLLTDRLGLMLALSLVFAALGAVLGHFGAATLPGYFGFQDTSSAGMMAVAMGVLFAASLLFAPRYGLLSRAIHRARLRIRILADDVLGVIYRLEEIHEEKGLVVHRGQFSRVLGTTVLMRLAIWRLLIKKRITRSGSGYKMTETGTREARKLIRSHRLWETYLVQELGIRPDHVHGTAERLEHITDEQMEARLASKIRQQQRDPHDKAIPND